MIASLGVVVPAHDEQDLLPSCLTSLDRTIRDVRQAHDLSVHLVIVADACRDRTAEVARHAGAAVVPVSARCVGTARAAGVREVLRRTQRLDPADVWLATTDADTLVPAHWLRQQLMYADSGWDAVAGTVRVENWSERPPGLRAAFAERYGHGLEHPHVHGANLGFRAAAYLRAGGFARIPTGEDHALVAALTAGGGRVLRTRALPVVTSARRDSRAPLGFGRFLTDLEASSRTGPPPVPEPASAFDLDGPR